MIKDIIEGNKLIAEFVGMYSESAEYPFRQPNKVVRWKEAQYHTSWDWLMPVVEKICSLGGWEYCIFANGCTINGDHEQPPYISETEGNTINATWQAVIQFIQWYNNQK